MAKRIEEQLPVKSEPTPDDVERRAYELYKARGGEPGADLDPRWHAGRG